LRQKRTLIALASAGVLLLAIPVATAFGSARPPSNPEPRFLAASALVDAITYNGRLTESAAPANGAYDLQFVLYDAVTGGSQVGGTNVETKDNVNVSNGVFTVDLNFGLAAWNGDARWIEIGVRAGTSTGAFTVLSPRQPVTAAPYALYAKKAAVGLPFSGSANNGETVFQITQLGAGAAVQGAGSGANSVGGSFKGPQGGAAVDIEGPIRVSGPNGSRAAFIHTASNANDCNVNSVTGSGSFIDNPLANDGNAMLQVTQVGASPLKFSVLFDADGSDPACSLGRWVIVSDVAIPDGTKFNVLVVNSGPLATATPTPTNTPTVTNTPTNTPTATPTP
jgi:hypothetical protein